MISQVQLGTITILLKDREIHSLALQKIFSKYGYLIKTRLGVNLEPKCFSHCTGLITLVVEGTKGEIMGLTKKINTLKNTVARAVIITK